MNVISPLVNRASIRFEKRFATALSPANKRVTFSYDDIIVLKYLYWLEKNKLNAIFNWLAREKKRVVVVCFYPTYISKIYLRVNRQLFESN